MILYTQYNDEEWYGRIDPEYDEGSPVAEAIMDRITNNASIFDDRLDEVFYRISCLFLERFDQIKL